MFLTKIQQVEPGVQMRIADFHETDRSVYCYSLVISNLLRLTN
jgi:hypothetical protein